MLHTKFRGNRPAGSGEEDLIFEGFLLYISDFHFLIPESFHTKFASDRHSRF